MDAYDPGIHNIDNAQANQDVKQPLGSAAVGFNAKAYTYNGETIISYRGTDTFILDSIFGYQSSIGLGSKQSELAAQFYQTVVGDAAFPFSTSVTFTGHSLGGGLAGLMAGLYGKQAVVFDNMAFRDAAAWTYRQATTPFHPGVVDPLTGQAGPAEANILYQPTLDTFYHGTNPVVPNFNGISGYRMDGQFLNFQSDGYGDSAFNALSAALLSSWLKLCVELLAFWVLSLDVYPNPRKVAFGNKKGFACGSF